MEFCMGLNSIMQIYPAELLPLSAKVNTTLGF